MTFLLNSPISNWLNDLGTDGESTAESPRPGSSVPSSPSWEQMPTPAQLAEEECSNRTSPSQSISHNSHTSSSEEDISIPNKTETTSIPVKVTLPSELNEEIKPNETQQVTTAEPTEIAKANKNDLSNGDKERVEERPATLYKNPVHEQDNGHSSAESCDKETTDKGSTSSFEELVFEPES